MANLPNSSKHDKYSSDIVLYFDPDCIYSKRVVNALRDREKIRIFAKGGSYSRTSRRQPVDDFISLNRHIPRMNRKQVAALRSYMIEVLDNSESVTVFKILCSLCVMCFKCNTDDSESKISTFRDFIDIVLGWMVSDMDETFQSVPAFCSSTIQLLSRYFKEDLDFTSSLISQVFDDIQDAGLKIKNQKDPENMSRLLRLITAAVTLLKLGCDLDKIFLSSVLENYVQLVSILKNNRLLSERVKYELFIASHECLACETVDGPQIRSFLRAELNTFNETKVWLGYPKVYITGFMSCLSCWIETASGQAQSNPEIEEMFEESTKFIDILRPYLTSEEQSCVLKVVHSLLRTRNITYLQKNYAWLLSKRRHIDDENLEDTLFVITGIADLAGIKSGSILSQWALDPPIFDLLLSLVTSPNRSINVDAPDAISALQLLRVHCEAHSHFISSIASSKSYVSESIGTRSARFLPSIMEFWLGLLNQGLHSQLKTWLMDWVISFMKSSAPFLSLLVETSAEFYTRILHSLLSDEYLHNNLVELVRFVSEDQYYLQSQFITDLLRKTTSRLIFLPSTKSNIKEEASSILIGLPPKIDLRCDNNAIASSECLQFAEGFGQLQLREITNYEFSLFLHDLLSYERIDSVETYTTSHIEGMVEFLMQSKLKTAIAKPVEFFGHLKTLLKKYRKGKSAIPSWKLDFLYILEKHLVNAIYGSAFIRCSLPEAVRNFYQTNKSSCTEWLKRFRSDLAELSLVVENYSCAFRSSSMVEEDLVAKFALLELGDSEGLKGLSELSGYYYLQHEIEKAMEVVRGLEQENVNSFHTLIMKRCEAIMGSATSSLEAWSDTTITTGVTGASNSLHFKLRAAYPKELNLQMETLKTRSNLLDLEIQMDFRTLSQLNFFDLLQVSEIVKRNPSPPSSDKQLIQGVKLEAMMKFGNIEYIRAAIMPFREILETGTVTLDQLSIYKIFGDLYYYDGAKERSALVYVGLMDLVEKNSSILNASFIVQFYLSFASKLQTSEAFFGKVLETSVFLCAIKDKNSVLQSLYETATLVSQIDGDAWFDYGNFAFVAGTADPSVQFEVASTMKTLAQHCFSRYFVLRTSIQDGMKWRAMQARTRLLRLYESGYKFNPEEVLLGKDWLPLLPSLSRIKDLRPHLVLRFPEEASFLVAIYIRERKFKRVKGRRGIFDVLAYSLTELNEESYSPPCQDDCAIKQKNLQREVREETSLAANKRMHEMIDPTVLLIIEELERIGCLREELWSWSIDKVIPDATRRLAALRKDMARGSDPLKVQAYINPLFSYLKELWDLTRVAETKAEVIFLNKYGAKIELFMKKLEASQSSEDFNKFVEELLAFRCSFDASPVSKLELQTVSPKLSNLDVSAASISIPGFSSGVHLSSVHPVITCFHSKAKPKRLSFLSSNGQLYNYLVKGNENLYIDSGVMQLLKIVQDILGMQTHSYSVTPFGEKGGLIQYVENAPAFYEIYKRHLQRLNCSEKPLYMFYRMLNDLGYSDRSNLEALKSVYSELVNVTDAEIISRELLLCSSDCSTWYKSMRNFTRDSAVGAAVGYLVGIGDRHLDNILLNPRTGHLVHVDFSLVFGRGLTLPVPEIVPFRLTRNFTSPLQYPGSLGPFRVFIEQFVNAFVLREDTFLFGVEEISVATQCEESFVVNPEVILSSELQSAMQLLRIRARNLASSQQGLMKELGEAAQATARDRKSSGFSWQARTDYLASNKKSKGKIYRWRRLLANVDPLIQFIARHVYLHNELETFHQIVIQNWLPNVIHFWCHSSAEELLQQTDSFADHLQLAELTFQSLLFHLPTDEGNLRVNDLILTSGEQALDGRKIEAKLTSTRNKLSLFDSNTVEELVASATNDDNLCQMFEGWTPWF